MKIFRKNLKKIGHKHTQVTNTCENFRQKITIFQPFSHCSDVTWSCTCASIFWMADGVYGKEKGNPGTPQPFVLHDRQACSSSSTTQFVWRVEMWCTGFACCMLPRGSKRERLFRAKGLEQNVVSGAAARLRKYAPLYSSSRKKIRGNWDRPDTHSSA